MVNNLWMQHCIKLSKETRQENHHQPLQQLSERRFGTTWRKTNFSKWNLQYYVSERVFLIRGSQASKRNQEKIANCNTPIGTGSYRQWKMWWKPKNCSAWTTLTCQDKARTTMNQLARPVRATEGLTKAEKLFVVNNSYLTVAGICSICQTD